MVIPELCWLSLPTLKYCQVNGIVALNIFRTPRCPVKQKTEPYYHLMRVKIFMDSTHVSDIKINSEFVYSRFAKSVSTELKIWLESWGLYY